MDNWKTVPISSFLKERTGKYKPDDKALGGLKRLNKIDFKGNVCLSDKPTKTDMIIVQPGDLVISGINVAKGAISVHEGSEPITATIHYSSYSFDPKKINIHFFKRFLKSPAFVIALKEQVRGGIKTEIKAKDFLPIQIALPEIQEQQKISTHFDCYEQELAELNTEQRKQSSYLSQLRQAILQEAIEGKLTADWRKKHPVKKGDPNTDTAALLEQIKVEKQNLIAAGKLKKEKPLAPIKPDEIPFELPNGWVWCKLGEITECMTYGTSQSCSYDINQNTKVLRIPNISSGYISADDLKYTNLTESEREELFLREGDVLVIRSNGSCNIVGLGVFVPITFAGYCYAGYLIRLRFKFIALGQYVSIIFATKLIRNQIEDPLRTTVGINNINTQELSNLLFPFPPLAEQQAIVECVDRLLEMVDELEQQVKARQQQAEQLMQSVLREAFEQN